MQERLLDFLLCPDCKEELKLIPFELLEGEISVGVLHCHNKHYFPVYKGIPRMLPNSLKDYWTEIEKKSPALVPEAIQALIELKDFAAEGKLSMRGPVKMLGCVGLKTLSL